MIDSNSAFSRIWAVYEAGGLLTMCAWCNRVRIDDEWLFAPRAALVAVDEPSTISHSICEACLERFGSRAHDVAYSQMSGSQ